MQFVTVASIFAAAINAAAVGRPCSSIPTPHLPGASILSLSSTELRNHSVQAVPPLLNTNFTNLNVCEVVVTLSHPGANDTVKVQIWLPLDGAWTGRFASAGGSGWAAGHGPLTLAPLAADGYAAASTDAGLTGDISSPARWALKPDGTVNLDLLTNFASRSVHDMAVVGKAVTASFYGRPAAHSYWTGCSTGGRQGMVAAQKYPGDFDGILAGSPAIYWTEYVVAELWPQVVMKEAGYFPSTCELAAVRADLVSACDTLDGVKDGVISDISRCNYDPFSLVGQAIPCDGKNITFTSTTASIVQKIWDGPRTPSNSSLWYGLPKDSPFDALAATVPAPTAGTSNTTTTLIGSPFFVADTWTRYFVKADPAFDPRTLTTATLTALFAESVSKFSPVIDSSSPDLSPFHRAGGKLLAWHGTADHIIFPQDTVRYRRAVEAGLGRGGGAVDDFFRVFLAPGTDHCGLGSIGGVAPPTDALGALAEWVEKGRAPDVLLAATLPGAEPSFTRKLCRFPLVARYDGRGDPSVEGSYRCVKKGCE